jgi:peptidoglycan/LPS O-acetylase OafA/YrhL
MTSLPAEPGTAAPALRGDSDWRIELFRAIAASLVLSVHYLTFFTDRTTYANFFFTGVDLFFVLSGYVFAPYLVEQRSLKASPFFTRRFFRIYPLYLLALAAYAALKWHEPALGTSALKHVFMLHTLENRQVAFFFNAAFWSLPPETEFYICLPLFAWLCRKRYGFAWLVAGAVVLRIVVNSMSPNSVDGIVVVSFHLPGLLIEFLLGALAYLAVRRFAKSTNAAWAAICLLAGLLALWLWGSYVVAQLASGGNSLLESNPLTRGNVGWFAAIGYAAVLAGSVSLLSRLAPSGRIAKAALWAGGCSYAVYLFHTLAPAVFERSGTSLSREAIGVISIIITVLVAALLHRWYEEPLRQWGRRKAVNSSFPPRRESRASGSPGSPPARG